MLVRTFIAVWLLATTSALAHENVFDITDYGAVEGGAVDSTEALEDALAAQEAQGYGEVYIPAGVYKISSAVTHTFPTTC